MCLSGKTPREFTNTPLIWVWNDQSGLILRTKKHSSLDPNNGRCQGSVALFALPCLDLPHGPWKCAILPSGPMSNKLLNVNASCGLLLNGRAHIVSTGNGMRWGQQGDQGPNYIGSMKTAIGSLHFIKCDDKIIWFLKDNSCYCVKIGLSACLWGEVEWGDTLRTVLQKDEMCQQHVK